MHYLTNAVLVNDLLRNSYAKDMLIDDLIPVDHNAAVITVHEYRSFLLAQLSSLVASMEEFADDSSMMDDDEFKGLASCVTDLATAIGVKAEFTHVIIKR